MAESYSVEAVLSAVDKNMSSGFAKAASNATSFGEKIGAVTKGIGKSMTVAGAAITAFGVKTVQSYGNFTSSVNKAAVIAGSSNKDLSRNINDLTKVALDLGKELPISAQDAGNAMVEMARNGASISDLKKEFPSIARAAAVSGEDLSQTATTVQQAMNIWGGGAQNAAKDSATLAIVANKSNAEIGDMQQVFANVGTAAKNMGFSLKDVAIASGIMTNAGIPAAQASMDLNHAFTQMVKPSKTAKGEMDKLGISFVDAHGEMKPLKTIIQEVAAATDGMSGAQKQAALSMMFGSAGAKAMAPLLDSVAKGTINGKKGWNGFSSAIDKGAGTTAKANQYLTENAQNMTHNVGDAIDQMKDAWTDLMYGAMSTSAPIIQSMANKFAELADKIASNNSPMANFAKAFIAFAPMIGTATTAVGIFLTNVGKIGSIMAGATKFLVSPWGLALTAITAVAGGLVYAYNKITPFHNAVNNVGKAFMSAFGTIARDTLGALKGLLIGIGDDFKQIGQAIQTQVGDKLKNVNFSDFASRASMAIQNVIAFIGQLLNAITDVITGFIKVGAVQSIWNALKAVFQALVNIVKALIAPVQNVIQEFSKGSESKSVWEQIGEAIGKVVQVVSGAVEKVANFVSALMKIKGVGPVIDGVVASFAGFKIATGIYKMLSSGVFTVIGAFTRVSGVITTVVTAIRNFGIASKVATAAQAAFNLVMNANPIMLVVTAIAAVVAALVVFFTKTKLGQQIWASFTTWLVNAWNIIKASAISIWQGLGEFFSNLWTGIKTTAITVWTSIGTFLTTIWNTIKTTAITVWNGIKTFFITIWTGIKTSATSIFGGLSSFFSGLWNGIKSVAVSVWNALKGSLSSIWNGIVSVARGVWGLLKSVIMAPVLLVIDLVTGDFKHLKSDVSLIWNSIKSAASSIWNGIKSVISGIVKAVVSVVKLVFNGLKSAVSAIWNGIKSVTSSVWNAIKTTAINAAKKLASSAKSAWNGLKSAASSIWNGMKSGVSSAWNSMKSVASNAARALASAAKSAWNGLKSAASGIWNGIKSTISSGINGAKSAVSSAVSGMKSAATSAWNAMKSAASSVVSGIKSAFHSLSNIDLGAAGRAIMNSFHRGLTAAWGKTKSFVSGIGSWIRKHKGPISYDKKLLIPAGKAIMNGLNAGLNTNFRNVQKNVSSMAGAISKTANNALNSSVQALNSHIRSGSITSDITGQLSVKQQPAIISLDLGGSNYTAFVDDISHKQGQSAKLKRTYRI